MSRTLVIDSRQRSASLDLAALRRLTRTLLSELLLTPEYELGIHFTAAPEMTELNETFLRHKGSTDVITFDYTEDRAGGNIHGEIFICVDEAMIQARRFGTPWQSELARYVVHGLLHLHGFDDRKAVQRTKMKRVENRLVRELAERFSFRRMGTLRKP